MFTKKELEKVVWEGFGILFAIVALLSIVGA
jgi:hypothetical protein